MDNFLLLAQENELSSLSRELGFSRTFFAEDVVLIPESKPTEILQKAQRARQQKKISLFFPKTEAGLRFALEKAPLDMVLKGEELHLHDSLHYPRSGLNPVLCALAAARKITFAFSFAEILQSPHRARLLTRMLFNVKLCQKYKVRTLFSNFSSQKEEMRSAADLFSFWRLLGGKNKEGLAWKRAP